MQIKTLLQQADRCTSMEDVPALCAVIREALAQTKLFSRVKFEQDTQFKHEALVSEAGAHVHLRFNRQHSDMFLTRVSLIIDEEGFAMSVITSNCQAGFGNSEYSMEGMEDEYVDTSPEDTLEEVMAEVRALAVKHQRILLELVGVPNTLSAEIAEKLW
jgi:hypothetical protein